MFVPHLAEIQIDRKEPVRGFDHEKAARQLVEQFRRIAERVVQKDLLKRPNKDRRKAAEKRIRDSIETEERMKTVKEFVERWNYWREKYLSATPIQPKTKSQLTSIERAIQFAEEKEFDLNILIAVIHRTHQKRKFRPGFNAVVQYGEELYEKFYDDVIADIDRWTYEEDSYSRL